MKRCSMEIVQRKDFWKIITAGNEVCRLLGAHGWLEQEWQTKE